jgi:hypothetical protein
MLAIGTDVEVRERFCGRWAPGYQIAEAASGFYLVRRISDRTVLPASFAGSEIRPAR